MDGRLLKVDDTGSSGSIVWEVATGGGITASPIIDAFGNIYTGLIATGDEFITKESSVSRLKDNFEDLLGVEMEGASVAQVAIQEKIPWQILRVVSDNANNSSPQDFEEFLKTYQQNSAKIINALLENINSSPLKQIN